MFRVLGLDFEATYQGWFHMPCNKTMRFTVTQVNVTRAKQLSREWKVQMHIGFSMILLIPCGLQPEGAGRSASCVGFAAPAKVCGT